ESLRFAKEDSEIQIGNFNKEIQRNFREIERTNRTFIDSAKNEFERTRVELEEIRSTIHSDLDLLQDSKERIISGFSEESGAIAQEINSLSLQIQDIKAYSEHFANVEEIIRNSEDTIRSISEKMEELHSSKDSLDEYTKNAEMLKIAKKEMESEIRLLDERPTTLKRIIRKSIYLIKN
ncbi:MAG: hypothetical protein K8R21_03730, partial [Leptospira sp.]|nr:hypothetical protein [Leptospira sp.]